MVTLYFIPPEYNQCNQQQRSLLNVQVRNNIMIALADLCIQYTALVDSHVPKLAACIRDPSEFVRRQGLALLANLLSKVRTAPFL